MALHEKKFAHGPKLIDFKSTAHGVFQISDLAALWFLEASKSEVRFERTILGRISEGLARRNNFALQRGGAFQITFQAGPEDTRATHVRKSAQTFAGKREWLVCRRDLAQERTQAIRFGGVEPTEETECDVDLLGFDPAKGTAAEL